MTLVRWFFRTSATATCCKVDLEGLDLQCCCFRNFWSTSAALWQSSTRIKGSIHKGMDSTKESIEDQMEKIAFSVKEDEKEDDQLEWSELEDVLDSLQKLRQSIGRLEQECLEDFSMKESAIRLPLHKESQTEKSHDNFIAVCARKTPFKPPVLPPVPLPIETRNRWTVKKNRRKWKAEVGGFWFSPSETWGSRGCFFKVVFRVFWDVKLIMKDDYEGNLMMITIV